MGTSFFTTWEEKPGEAEWGWVFPWLGAAQRPFPKRSRGRPGLWVSDERQCLYLSILPGELEVRSRMCLVGTGFMLSSLKS